MERTLIKSSIYGLVFGLAFSILFFDYKVVKDLGNGNYVTEYKPVLDYIILILRCGIIGMFLGLFVGWLRGKKTNAQPAKTYYFPVFLAVFLLSMIGFIILNLYR